MYSRIFIVGGAHFLLIIFSSTFVSADSARDRMIAAGIEQGAVIVGDGIVVIQNGIAAETFDRPANAVQELSFAYKKEYQRQEFARAAVHFGNSIRDTALIMGGPVGMAAAATFNLTTDKLIDNLIERQGDEQRRLFANSLAKFSDAQFEELVNSSSEDRLKRFSSFTRDLLNTETFKDLDDKGKDVVHDIGMQLIAKVSTAALVEARKAGETTLAMTEDVKALTEDISEASERIDDLSAEFTALNAKTESIAMSVNYLVERDYLRSSPEEQLNIISRGGISFPSQEDRQAAFEEARTKLARQKISEGFQVSLGVVQGLETFASLISPGIDKKPFRDAARALQAGQAAYGVFVGFATGGPIGGLMALGSAGGLFGNGTDSASAQTFQQLEVISQKLDTVIKLQQKTLEQLTALQRSVDQLSLKIDELQKEVAISMSVIFHSLYAKALVHCQQILGDQQFQFPFSQQREMQSDTDKSVRILVLPFTDPRDFVYAHFLTPNRLALVNKDKQSCFNGIVDLSEDRKVLEFLVPTEAQGFERAKAEKDAFDTLYSFVSRYAQKWALSEVGLGAILSLPAKNVVDLRNHITAIEGDGGLSAWQLPCSWQGPVVNKTRCSHLQKTPTNDDIATIKSYLQPSAVMYLSDLTLSFYPTPLLPPAFPTVRTEKTPEAALKAYESQWNSMNGTEDSKALLERALWRTQMSVAQQALLQGDLVSAILGEAMLKPNVAPKDLEKCAEPHFRGIEDGRLLSKNHRVAHNAVVYALSRLLWPSGQSHPLNESALHYLHSISTPPARRSNMGSDWVGLARSTSEENHWLWMRGIISGKEQANLQWQFVYGRYPGDKASWKKVAKGDGDGCDVLKVVNTEAREIPEGWSVIVGKEDSQIVVPLPSLEELIDGDLDWSPTMQALYQRQEILIDERASFEVQTDPDQDKLVRRGNLKVAKQVFAVRQGAP